MIWIANRLFAISELTEALAQVRLLYGMCYRGSAKGISRQSLIVSFVAYAIRYYGFLFM